MRVSRYRWHRYFAMSPVRLTNGDVVWMEWVERCMMSTGFIYRDVRPAKKIQE